MRIFTLFLVSLSQIAFAQQPAIKSNLKKHIAFLADDKLEGRRAGTAGEQKAMQYILTNFQKIGIAPKGSKGFLQPFTIRGGKEVGANNSLSFNKQTLEHGKDFWVMSPSASKVYVAKTNVATEGKSQPWFIDIAKNFPGYLNNPHFDLNGSLYSFAAEAEQKGANALFFYSSTDTTGYIFNKTDKKQSLNIPVVFVSKKIADQLFVPGTRLNLKLKTDVIENKRTGHNVIGYIDNHAANTVVLGAHFDHLGYGEDGGSTWRGEGNQIHNGADDNASGTAALIELARLLKSSKAKNNNYLFIAFSAEELGLFGSKYFVENPTVNLKQVNYMINMDMVGRLNDSSKTITVGGFGTSPAWSGVIKSNDNFNVKIDSSGAGPSDHTSFYRKDIPVLFYFTGLHTDYHKPSDDFDKINYEGTALITENILQLIEKLDTVSKLAFLKTRERQVVASPFKVTLGIMPDYTYSGAGVRADGVTEGRPAAKAGLKAGDIVTRIGDIVIFDMNAYMQALGKFEKGDTTTVKFKRGNEEKEVPITF